MLPLFPFNSAANRGDHFEDTASVTGDNSQPQHRLTVELLVLGGFEHANRMFSNPPKSKRNRLKEQWASRSSQKFVPLHVHIPQSEDARSPLFSKKYLCS